MGAGGGGSSVLPAGVDGGGSLVVGDNSTGNVNKKLFVKRNCTEAMLKVMKGGGLVRCVCLYLCLCLCGFEGWGVGVGVERSHACRQGFAEFLQNAIWASEACWGGGGGRGERPHTLLC